MADKLFDIFKEEEIDYESPKLLLEKTLPFLKSISQKITGKHKTVIGSLGYIL